MPRVTHRRASQRHPPSLAKLSPSLFDLLYARSPLGKHLGNITFELSLVPEVPSSLWNVMGTATGMPSECLLWAFWGPCPRSSPPLPVASLPLLPGRRMSRTRAVRLLPFRSLQGYCLVGGRFGAWWYEWKRDRKSGLKSSNWNSSPVSRQQAWRNHWEKKNNKKKKSHWKIMNGEGKRSRYRLWCGLSWQYLSLSIFPQSQNCRDSKIPAVSQCSYITMKITRYFTWNADIQVQADTTCVHKSGNKKCICKQ